MFETDGDADEAGRDADGGAFFGGQFGVCRAGGVGGDATGVSQVCRECEQFQLVEKIAAGFEAAFEIETDDAAAVAHLALCDGILRVAG